MYIHHRSRLQTFIGFIKILKVLQAKELKEKGRFWLFDYLPYISGF